MRGLPADVLQLSSFKRKLEKRRGEHLESMAVGRSPDQYHQLVGRAAESKWLIDEIQKFLKNFDVEGE